MSEPKEEPRPLPPEKPLPGDCCDSGCERCVYVVYEEEMDAYREALRAWESRQRARS